MGCEIRKFKAKSFWFKVQRKEVEWLSGKVTKVMTMLNIEYRTLNVQL